MIYRLRRKFIGICTLSFMAVFLLLLLGIYIVTERQAAARARRPFRYRLGIRREISRV